MQSPRILQVAIPTPLRRTFDYLIAPNNVYQTGQRVSIPFGRREVVGVIVSASETSEFPVEKLKTISAVIDETPLIDEKLLSLYHWASDYYQHPLGDVILGTLPKKIRDGSVLNNSVSQLAVMVARAQASAPISANFQLTSEQTHAINLISNTKKFQPFLLSGVTGSGKTEVYLQVIANVLTNNQQALVLVPEIALTPQTVERFEARFAVPILLLHSGLTDKKRCEAWLQATDNKPCIVIGTRSAIFAPLKNCGVIIVDEEHDVSFKQQSGFRYSARDIAVMRAKIADIPVVLGTATPSLETWSNVAKEKYQLLTLPDRAGSAQMPSITLHNICNEKLHQGLSKKLIDVMRRHLNQGNQILLFLNRRGYAPVLLCHHCGWTAQCLHCDAKVTMHDQPKKLLCHHCGYQSTPPRICPSCKQSELMSLGMGTEQLEETLTRLFADKKICRIDRDNIKNFKTLKTTLQKVHDREVDILIGTQMLVKGHHFENVTLVAALNVDNALFSGDFRAIERLGQSLVQVAGRAGRGEKLGEVFIQTHHPEHPLLKKLFHENYAAFADVLLQERMQAKLPPFQSMCLLRAEGKNKTHVHEFLQQVKNQMTSHASIEMIGPIAATMEKKAGFYRAQLILQSPHRSLLKNAMELMLQWIERQKKLSGLRWSIDVDPMEVG